MRVEEAREIARWFEELDLPKGTVCLNVGSSTLDFRSRIQPHIQSELFDVLEAKGFKVIHCDMKEAEGVDEVGDLMDPEFRKHLAGYRAQIMLCSNLLEHLEDPVQFATACGDLVVPGGYGFFSVPLSYPYHPDPIDTMFRPTPEELAAILPDWKAERRQILTSSTYLQELTGQGRTIRVLSSAVARTLMPFYRANQWKHIAHRLLWLWRPFTLSMVLLRKPA